MFWRETLEAGKAFEALVMKMLHQHFITGWLKLNDYLLHYSLEHVKMIGGLVFLDSPPLERFIVHRKPPRLSI